MFWEDNWMGGAGPLLAKYPRLYAISCQQNHIIQQMGMYRDIGWEWDFRWRQSLFESEIDMTDSFLRDVECCIIQPQNSDQWVWLADTAGQYSAKSAYSVLRGESPEEVQVEAFQELWKLKAPNKISAFAWRLLNDRLLTRANLTWRQIDLEDNTCPFCSSMEESAGHLFFHCRKFLPVWCLVGIAVLG